MRRPVLRPAARAAFVWRSTRSTATARPRPASLDKRALAVGAVSVGLFVRNHRCRRDAVALFEPHQPHALRRAAGLANLGGFGAEDLAILGDDDDVARFLDAQDGDDFAVALRRLHVDNAFAAARR